MPASRSSIPILATRRLIAANPGLGQHDANAAAWNEGRELLERAIRERLDFAFETTLGGTTMTSLLALAADAGIEVRLWYVGLQTPELHLERVRRRVAKGGHDIPEAAVRRRYDQSRRNLIRLMSRLTELKVFDNSAEGDPDAGIAPAPQLLLHWRAGKVAATAELVETPEWAKPIVAAALKLGGPVDWGPMLTSPRFDPWMSA